MGDVIGHLPQAGHQAGDAIEHAVERRRHPVQIVVRTLLGNAAGQVAVDNPFRCGSHGGQAPMHIASKAVTADDAEGDDPGEGPREAGQDRVLKFLVLLVDVSDHQAMAVRQHGGQHTDGLCLALGCGLPRLDQPRGFVAFASLPASGSPCVPWRP